MSIFQPDPLSPINNVSSTTYRLNLQDTVASRETEFGTIDPKDYLITRYNNLVNFEKVDNKMKNIRLTLTPDSVRGNKFDFFSAQFDPGYPLNSNNTFCPDKLSTVFNTGASYWTKSFSTKYSYPIVDTFGNVTPNTLNSCIECPNGTILDPITKQCVSCSSITCLPGQIPDPISCSCVLPPECEDQTECPPPITIPNIKNTIQGYVFYLDKTRDLDIPGLSQPVHASCYGGHRCCRTLFMPTLVKSDLTEIQANRSVNLNNNGCSSEFTIPAPGFVPATTGERSDTFTITLPNASDIINSSVYLECLYPQCHNGVTFVVLVAELAASTDKILIFSSCLVPGPLNRVPIGTIDCPGEPEICDGGDVAYSCYDGLCKNVALMGYFGFGLWLNDPTCGGGIFCDPTSPTETTPTTTPTPTPTETTPTPTPLCVMGCPGCCVQVLCGNVIGEELSGGSGVYYWTINPWTGPAVQGGGCIYPLSDPLSGGVIRFREECTYPETNCYNCCDDLVICITEQAATGMFDSATGDELHDVVFTVGSPNDFFS